MDETWSRKEGVGLFAAQGTAQTGIGQSPASPCQYRHIRPYPGETRKPPIRARLARSVVLLKSDQILPVQKEKLKTIAVIVQAPSFQTVIKYSPMQ
jgi:hypothetical protein